jgi:peroxiredoxin
MILNPLKFLTITALLLTACADKMQSGNLNGKINNAEGKTLYLDRISNTGQEITDSIKLNAKGEFAFNVKVETPGFFRIRLGDSNFALLFLEPETKVDVEADGNNLAGTYLVKGSEENNRLAKATHQLISFGERAQKLNEEAGKHADIMTNQAMQQSYQEKFELIKKEEDEMVKKYINENAESLTCLALIDRLEGDDNMEYYKKLRDGLMKKYASNDYAKSFIERVNDMLKLSVGSPAPEINLNTPDGKTIALSSLKGKVVLIDFWASWCRPCRMENPNVVRIYNQYKAKGFEIYGVSLDRDQASWEKAIADDKLTWLHVSDLGYWNSSVVKLYNISGIPMTYIIDRNGNIAAKNLRGEELEKKIAEMVK